MAKYVWSLTAHVLGVTCRPTNFDQFWEWAEQYIQNSKKFHMVGLAAICWALWRSMNNVFFENKKVRSDWGCLSCLLLSWLLGRAAEERRHGAFTSRSGRAQACCAGVWCSSLRWRRGEVQSAADLIFLKPWWEDWRAWRMPSCVSPVDLCC